MRRKSIPLFALFLCVLISGLGLYLTHVLVTHPWQARAHDTGVVLGLVTILWTGWWVCEVLETVRHNRRRHRAYRK